LVKKFKFIKAAYGMEKFILMPGLGSRVSPKGHVRQRES